MDLYLLIMKRKLHNEALGKFLLSFGLLIYAKIAI